MVPHSHPELRARGADELEAQGLEHKAAKLRACCDFGSALRCDSPCGEARVFIPWRCRLRTCPVCAPLETARLRRQWAPRFRYVTERQARPGHRAMMVTLTFKTIPAVLWRLERQRPRTVGAPGESFSPFVRWAFGVAAAFLRELYPGEPDPPAEGAGKRARRRRRGAGGIAALEVGGRGHVHVHALAFGRYYDKRRELQEWWRERAAYRACSGCGSFRAGRGEAPCEDSSCERVGQPLELVESFIVDARSTRPSRRSSAAEYVLKYLAKPGPREDPKWMAGLEALLSSVHRIRAWGSLMGIPQAELEAEGYALEPPQPLECPVCAGKLRREETMQHTHNRPLTVRTLELGGYVYVGDWRRKRPSG